MMIDIFIVLRSPKEWHDQSVANEASIAESTRRINI